MDITEKLKLYEVGVNYPKSNIVTVQWRLCDPKDDSGDSCEDVDIDLDWWYTPEEPDVGVTENFEVEEVKFGQHVTYMGKKYRYGQAFPKQLRKHVLEFTDPMPSSAKKYFRNDWEAFTDYALRKKLGVRH